MIGGLMFVCGRVVGQSGACFDLSISPGEINR